MRKAQRIELRQRVWGYLKGVWHGKLTPISTLKISSETLGKGPSTGFPKTANAQYKTLPAISPDLGFAGASGTHCIVLGFLKQYNCVVYSPGIKHYTWKTNI
jgi:hypothetical protein